MLSKSAQSVQYLLQQKGLSTEVKELSSSTRTAKDAANTIGCEVAQIVKSILFRTQHSQQPVLVLASGVNHIVESKIEELINVKIEKADAAYTREVTGYAIGGLPPVAHKQSIKHIFIDQDLLQHESLWAAAGTPNAVFCLKPRDLQTLTNGKIVAIK